MGRVAPIRPAEGETTLRLRLMTYNIRYGGRGHEAQILHVIQAAQPDVIVLQEVTRSTLVRDIAASLHYTCFVASGRRFDVALLSRFPIVETHSHTPFPPVRDAILEAAVEYAPGQRVSVIGVHPIAYPGAFIEYWREWELRIALRRVLSHRNEACIMAGDFNAISPNDRVLLDTAPRIMRLLYGLQRGYLYRHAMRNLLAAGLIDCYRQMHPTYDGFTIPTPAPKVRLDYILANAQISPRLARCEVVTEPADVHSASDHYPLVAEFEME